MHVDVVVLGWLGDSHVDSVLVHLDAAGVSSICLNQITLWHDTVTFQPENMRLQVGDQALTSCLLIWNRRAYPTALDYMNRGEKKFARGEFVQALFGALRALSKTWFNSPDAVQYASYKATQLAWVAGDGRLKFPHSLITSNVDQANAFINSKPCRYIIKPLYLPLIESDHGTQVVYTSLVDTQIREHLGEIKNSPCIVQEFIERKYDARVNVVGNQIFGTRMDTRHIEEAAIDGRRVYDYHDILHTPIELPSMISSACTDMCKDFGLRFGAFDFVIDENDNWFFLEVNPNGQWYWIEEMTGQPLSAAMASEIYRLSKSATRGFALKS